MNNHSIISKIITVSSFIFSAVIEGVVGWLIDEVYHNLSYKIAILSLLIIGIIIMLYFQIVRTKIKKKIWYRVTLYSVNLSVISLIILAYFACTHIGHNGLGFYLKGNHLTQSASDYKEKESLTEDELNEDLSNKTHLVYADSGIIEKTFFWIVVITMISLDVFTSSISQLKKFNRSKRVALTPAVISKS